MATEKTTDTSGIVSAADWFADGTRRPYHPSTKTILGAEQDGIPHVFERVENAPSPGSDQRWTTFLPGFPDGSFGYSRVNELLTDMQSPRLFVEYLGQGDSDKPARYKYSTVERADLVEALWRDHAVKSTFVVTFDFSSLVLLELLARQDERTRVGERSKTRIEEVLIVNGGLFADSHSHPWQSTPLLKSPFGRASMVLTQRSPFMFGQIMKSSSLFAKDYALSTAELREAYSAISRRDGAAFLHNGSRFVDEHHANSERWDLARIFNATRDSVTFHLAGSVDDPFEPKQLVAASKRLRPNAPDTVMFPGGHMTTSEHPDLLAALIDSLTIASTAVPIAT